MGFIGLGLFFILAGTIGNLRFSHGLDKLHFIGLMEVLGVPLVLGGCCFYLEFAAVFKILVLAWFFAFLSPVSTHLLAKLHHENA